ncbi:hypothetical protein HS125_08920 [bacterium]|nr:hypothetical protein [bacterium]
MRIAVAADDANCVSTHTGRCQGFVIFDVVNGVASRREYRENAFREEGACPNHSRCHNAEGERPHLHDTLMKLLSDCDVLVARGVGQRLIYDLQCQGIETFLCDNANIAETARLFAAGRLAPLSGAGPCREE